MSEVPYDLANLQKCRCNTCPVHNDSPCIHERVVNLQPRPDMLPDPNLVERVYCSQGVGRSDCSDLNGMLACVCPTCAVWQEDHLLTNYFCMRGPASR